MVRGSYLLLIVQMTMTQYYTWLVMQGLFVPVAPLVYWLTDKAVKKFVKE